jgi:hypothetical protein
MGGTRERRKALGVYIEGLGGVPILVREFKDGNAVAETSLTGMRPDVPSASLLDVPDGYPVQERTLGVP